MKTQDNYIARNLFNEVVFALISEYLENEDAFTDEVVAVNLNTKELQLISPKMLEAGWESYPVSQFIRKNEDGSGLEPDVDATLDLADNYFFPR
jgi:hypothetical protein